MQLHGNTEVFMTLDGNVERISTLFSIFFSGIDICNDAYVIPWT